MKKYSGKFTDLMKSKEFQKFFVVGISSFLLDFAILNFLLYIVNLNTFLFGIISVPNLISSITAILFNYILQRRWTFKSENTAVIRESLKFFSVHGFNLIIFNGILFGFLAQLGFPKPLVKIFVTGVQLFFSFALYKFFVFKKKSEPEIIEEVVENIH